MGPVVRNIHLSLAFACGIQICHINCHVVVQNWGTPGQTADIPRHVGAELSHIMQALKKKCEIQWSMRDVESHVTSCVTVEVKQ